MTRALAAVGCAVLLFVPVGGLFAAPAGGRVVDRIVAVVASEIVLLSDLMIKARPALAELDKAGGDELLGADKRRAKILRETLEKMIDDIPDPKGLGEEPREGQAAPAAEGPAKTEGQPEEQ